MMKYPIGIQSFDKLREGGYVYIDKTALIYNLITTGNIYFLSRPRRFGKSLLVSTLEAYFNGRKELFKGLDIAELEKDWHQYPVFHIDFNGVDFSKKDNLEDTIQYYLNEWGKIYGEIPAETPAGKQFDYLLKQAYQQTGRRAVVLIDEYDKPILDVLDTPMEENNRNILKAFYSTFKSADSSLQFVLLTGVTKFSQVSVFSGFNQPKDLSMHPHYEALCGITQAELEHYFAEPIAELAQKYGCTAEDMKVILKRQYDGYHFGNNLIDIYNPFSILNTFDTDDLRNYWFASGTPTYLLKLLQHNKEQINDLTGKYYEPSMFVDYKADVEMPLPMIYQSGYLTIKDYSRRSGRYLLDFPNDEVRKGFLTMIATNYWNNKATNLSNWIESSAFMLEDGDTSAFRKSLTAFLSSIPYDAHASVKKPEATERHFQYTFYLILRLLGGNFLLLNERAQSQGRVDCILESKNFVYIFEFKLNGSATDALQQIEEKGYAKPYMTDPRKVMCIGVNFSSKSMTVEGWEERNELPGVLPPDSSDKNCLLS